MVVDGPIQLVARGVVLGLTFGVVGVAGGLFRVGSLTAGRWSYDVATVGFLVTLVGLYWVAAVASSDPVR